MTDKEGSPTKLKPNDRQTEATTEANKPDKARAEDTPKAGNILGGVQRKTD